MSSTSCESCGFDLSEERNDCPHCGRACRFPPNVRAAQKETVRLALERRYQTALRDAADRGVEEVFHGFESAAQTSKAVVARPLRDIQRLASSDHELYPTYYGLTRAEVRLRFGDKWDRLRGIADEVLFSGYQEHIRFAALTLDGIGLADFGDCYMVLREDMIAHRATVFEDNSASFVDEHNRIEPEGCRATWEERSKLCTAKNVNDLKSDIPASDFSSILLRQKTATEESRFVEVHVYGPFSVRSAEKVILKRDVKPSKKSFKLELRDRLAKVGVPLEVK